MSTNLDIRYTLCFLLRGNEVLMLHRSYPPNQGLWNGVGGKIEADEQPLESCVREVKEETGYDLKEMNFAGVLTWEGYETPPGGLYLFTAQAPKLEPHGNSEGELCWKQREWVCSADEVVSNIHVFGPIIFSGSRPKRYHFVYRDGIIGRYEIRPLEEDLKIQLYEEIG